MDHSLELVREDRTIDLAAPGPQGPPGPSGPSGVAIVEHGASSGIARPDATVVFWYGSVEPTNWTATDIWVEVV